MRIKRVSGSAQETLASEVCLFCNHYREIGQNGEITAQFRLKEALEIIQYNLPLKAQTAFVRPGCSKSYSNDFWKPSGMETPKPLGANNYCILSASCRDFSFLLKMALQPTGYSLCCKFCLLVLVLFLYTSDKCLGPLSSTNPLLGEED